MKDSNGNYMKTENDQIFKLFDDRNRLMLVTTCRNSLVQTIIKNFDCNAKNIRYGDMMPSGYKVIKTTEKSIKNSYRIEKEKERIAREVEEKNKKIYEERLMNIISEEAQIKGTKKEFAIDEDVIGFYYGKTDEISNYFEKYPLNLEEPKIN